MSSYAPKSGDMRRAWVIVCRTLLITVTVPSAESSLQLARALAVITYPKKDWTKPATITRRRRKKTADSFNISLRTIIIVPKNRKKSR
jgi:hypothetical protein